ncbi:hypothetical protein WJX84_011039 [Apatococcus fuscideae]|uniref:NAD(P)-binding domain-containing protein n=1 Tax=Apatococcus fuscideae TaxID=2026836 RepID=A0AAW1TDF4_9CHLO
MICLQAQSLQTVGQSHQRHKLCGQRITSNTGSLCAPQQRLHVFRRVSRERKGKSAGRCSICVRAAGGIGGIFGGSYGEIFVAGAAGQLGVRVVLQLIDAGFKVVAGVPDLEEAQAQLNFAKTYELIKKDNLSKLRLAEVDLGNEGSLASEMSRGGQVLVVVADAPVGKKADTRLGSRALAAAKEAGAGRFVLITPQGGAASGGGLLGIFNLGGGGSGGQSRLEKEVVSSGMDYVIVRHAKNDFSSARQNEKEAVKLQLGPAGSLPSRARYQPIQVAAATAAALQQASGNVILEAWSDSDAPSMPVAELLSSVLESATTEQEAPAASEPEPEEESSPEPESGLFGLGGSPAKSSGQNGAVPEEEPAAGGLFGTRSVRASKRNTKAADEPQSKRGGGLGGLLSGAKQEAQQVQPDGKSARKAAARAQKATTALAKKAGRKAGDRPGTAVDTEESGSSWLSLLGINQKTSYADDE